MSGPSPSRRRWLSSRYASAMVLILLAGGILGMVLTASTTSSSGLVFVPGSDANCSASPVYPCATVSVDGTGTLATMGISIPRSNLSVPQPEVYYTDPLEVHNEGTYSNTVAYLNVTDVTGAANLGNVTVYYCTSMTDDPSGSDDCASFSITGPSGGLLSGHNVLPDTLGPGEVAYIELVAFASDTSSMSGAVTFVLEMSASFQPTTVQQGGGGGGAPPASSSSSTSTSTSTSVPKSTSPVASTATVTFTTTKISVSTSTTFSVSTSVLTSVTTSTATTTMKSTITSTATQTLTATEVSTKTETTSIATTAPPPSQPSSLWWVWLLIIFALAVVLIILVRRWLKERSRKGAKLFWQRS